VLSAVYLHVGKICLPFAIYLVVVEHEEVIECLGKEFEAYRECGELVDEHGFGGADWLVEGAEVCEGILSARSRRSMGSFLCGYCDGVVVLG